MEPRLNLRPERRQEQDRPLAPSVVGGIAYAMNQRFKRSPLFGSSLAK